jgi:ribosomal protein S27AE
MNTDERCPRCGARMKSWHELEEDEHEVVKRLPASAEDDAAERQRLNRWCTRCWYESSGEETVA